MLLPAITGSGESVLVTARSIWRMTLVIAVAMLLPETGSVVVLVTVAVLVIVAPLAVLEFTLTTIVKVGVSLVATVALVKVIVPVRPGATESVRVQPAGVVTDT